MVGGEGVRTVRPLGHLRGEQARLVPGKEGRGVGVWGVAGRGLVVVGRQDAVEAALADAALLAGLLDDGLAAGNVARLGAAGPELVGAVTERGPLDRAEVLAALSGLLGDVVAGMG